MILPQSHETQSGNERLFAHAANEAIKVVGVRSQLPGLLFGEFVASLESLRDASVLDFEPLLPAIDIALGAAAKQSYRKVLDDSRLPEEVFPRSSHVVNAAIIGEKVLSVGQFRKSNAASPSGNSAVKAQLALKQLYEKAVSASGKNARDRVAELSERHIETGVNKDDVRAAYDEVVHGMCTQILETAYAAAGELEEVKKGFLRTIFGKRTLVDTSVNSGPNANRVLKEAIGLIESFMANPEKFMTQKIVEALRDKVKQKSSQTAVSDIEAILRNELTLLSKKLGTITLRGILLKEEKQERSPAIVSGTDAADVGKKKRTTRNRASY